MKITCLLHKIRSCNTWLLYAHDNIYIYYVVAERTKVPFLMLELEGCKRMQRKNRTLVTGRVNRMYSRKEARKWNVNRVQKRKSCHADCGVDSLLHMCLDTVIPVIIKFQSWSRRLHSFIQLFCLKMLLKSFATMLTNFRTLFTF